MAKGWSFGSLVAALKSAAFKDVGPSYGQVITVGDTQGIGSPVSNSAMATKYGGSFGYESAGPNNLYPNVSVTYVNLGGPTTQEWGQIAVSYGNSLRAWVTNKDYHNVTVRSAELYHTLNKPTAADVNALALNGGGTVNGNVTINGTANLQKETSIQGQLNQIGVANFGNVVNFYGATNLQKEASIQGQLNQIGVANFGNVVNFYGATFIKSTLDVDGYVAAAGGIYDGQGASATRVWSSRNQSFEYSLPGNGAGWVRDKQSGMIIQWGRVDLNDNAVINLNIPFPNNSWAVTISSDGRQVPTAPEIAQAFPINSSQWVGGAAYWTGSGWQSATGLHCTWIAIGN